MRLSSLFQKKNRRKMLMDLLHGEEGGSDWSACRQSEAGRGSAGHHITAPAFVFFSSNQADDTITDSSAHLHARSFRAKRNTAQKRDERGKRKNEKTFYPFEAGDPSNRCDGRGNSTAAAVRGKGKNKSRGESQKGGAADENGEPYRVCSCRSIKAF